MVKKVYIILLALAFSLGISKPGIGVEWTRDLAITDGIWVDARGYGESLNTTTIQAAITSIGSDNRKLVLSPGTWDINTSLVIPTNVCLVIPSGAILDIDPAATITINGPYECGLYQAFDCADGAVIFGVASVKDVFPEWWGIDGTADEVQINSAINSLPSTTGTDPFGASAFGGVVWLTGSYSIAAPIKVYEGVMLIGKSKFATKVYNAATSGENAIEVLDSGRSSGTEFFVGVKNMSIKGNSSSGHGLYVYQAAYGVYENLYISYHGGSGIYIKGLTVGGTFKDVYSHHNEGWGVSNNDTALGASAQTCTVQRYENCQFRVNTLGGALIFRSTQVTMVGCIYESNTGPGLRVEGWNNVIDTPYFENNQGGYANITGATNANPCVLTFSSGHDFIDGQKIIVYDVAGMTEINGLEFTVAGANATTLQLSGIDATGYGAYVSGGRAVADDVEFTVAITTCYGNILSNAQIDTGVIHVESADYNQIVSPKLSNSDPNILIDAGSAYNQIVEARIFNPLNLTDNGGPTYRTDHNQVDTLILTGVTGTAIWSKNILPFVDDTYWLGEIGSPYKAYKGIILKDTTDGKHYKITSENGAVTITALD